MVSIGDQNGEKNFCECVKGYDNGQGECGNCHKTCGERNCRGPLRSNCGRNCPENRRYIA